MIAYTRTIDFVADLFEELVDVPMRIIDSKKSKYIKQTFNKEEAEQYDLTITELVQYQRIPDTTRLIVIRSEDLPYVEQKIEGLVEGIKWFHIDHPVSTRKEYAYKSRSGEIRFKIGELRNERTLTT